MCSEMPQHPGVFSRNRIYLSKWYMIDPLPSIALLVAARCLKFYRGDLYHPGGTTEKIVSEEWPTVTIYPVSLTSRWHYGKTTEALCMGISWVRDWKC